jgi:Flp pilus assembly protein TadB
LPDGALDAALMRAPSTFDAPDHVDVSIDSGLSRDEAIKRLSQAVAERRYSRPNRYSRGFLRLGGAVSTDGVAITARPYVIPGVVAGYGAMTIELRAEVVDTEAGSRLTGNLTAPVRRTMLAFGLVAWSCFAAFALAGNRSTWPTWAFVMAATLILTVLWTWIIRRNQRMALHNAIELTTLVSSILAEPSQSR